MISFVWSLSEPLPAGTGGSENYTVGQVRELNRRGVPAQVVTVGLGSADGRDEFTDVPFHSVTTFSDIEALDGTVVFVNEAPPVATSEPAFQILHNPPPIRLRHRATAVDGARDRQLIATSRFAAKLWSDFLDIDLATVHVVYPFAEPSFAIEPRPANPTGSVRILYAGRLSPEKGIYTLLAAMHVDVIAEDPLLTFTATTAGADKPQGMVIERMLRAHPNLMLTSARKTPATMAALMAQHDIVVMPSNSQYWHETFGIVSIEAQHAGCRVVASDDGGLPETDCGGVLYVEPDNAEALAAGLRLAIAHGAMSEAQRRQASVRFTVSESVDKLLVVLALPPVRTPASVVRDLEALVSLPSHLTRVRTVIPPIQEALRPAG